MSRPCHIIHCVFPIEDGKVKLEDVDISFGKPKNSQMFRLEVDKYGRISKVIDPGHYDTNILIGQDILRLCGGVLHHPSDYNPLRR